MAPLLQILNDPTIVHDKHALAPGTTTIALVALALAALTWGGALAYRLVTGIDRPSVGAFVAYGFALLLTAGVTYDVVVLDLAGTTYAGRIEDASSFTLTTRVRRSSVTTSREIAFVNLVDDSGTVRCHGETTGAALHALESDPSKRLPFVAGLGMCLVGERPTMASTSLTMLGMVYLLGLMLCWPKKAAPQPQRA